MVDVGRNLRWPAGDRSNSFSASTVGGTVVSISVVIVFVAVAIVNVLILSVLATTAANHAAVDDTVVFEFVARTVAVG